jgi:hypothetical protein
MTSVQKFLRQRYVPNTILQAPTNNCYYVFVASAAAGNYVGNYPPGYMVIAANIPVPAEGALVRDMGKTIKCTISADSGSTFSTLGFFREVQVLSPSSPATATASTTFGVGTNASGAQVLPSAGNVGDRGYGTFYIPIVVEGIIASTAVLPTTYLPLGGQM